VQGHRAGVPSGAHGGAIRLLAQNAQKWACAGVPSGARGCAMIPECVPRATRARARTRQGTARLRRAREGATQGRVSTKLPSSFG
ncbi:hypothetical protein PIB30_106999, partial [Stylosanthes scabra]|nr:hypothetical protein [Stylosanthes scabra]